MKTLKPAAGGHFIKRLAVIITVRLVRFATDSETGLTDTMADIAVDGTLDAANDTSMGLRHVRHFLPRLQHLKKSARTGGGHGAA